jgi:nucleoside-diphosphate-sugar epimerase
VPRDETWPTRGIRTSHYSVDKAAQERVLDEFAAVHADLVIARLRTALVFQSEAGAQVGRYFLGPLLPRRLFAPAALPFLPLPAGLRLQVVHADDAAQAYLSVLLRRAGGAFNVAARDVLWPADLARLLDHGRVVTMPPSLVRPAHALAWRVHAIAADPGWLEMGMGVPLMDSARVRAELGWAETRSAAETLTEMLRGIVRRRGAASPSLRPRDRAVRRGREP